MRENYVFISHSTEDDGFIKELRKKLETRGFETWVDSRELVAGYKFGREIKKAIEQARAFIVVLSPQAYNSPRILKAINHARKLEKKQGKNYPVIPLLLEGVEPAALKLYFEKESVGIKIIVCPSAVAEVLPHIFAALSERLLKLQSLQGVVSELSVHILSVSFRFENKRTGQTNYGIVSQPLVTVLKRMVDLSELQPLYLPTFLIFFLCCVNKSPNDHGIRSFAITHKLREKKNGRKR